MLFPEPADDLLARPVVIVVEVQDDRVERQPLVAAFGAATADVLQAVEQAIQPRPDRTGLLRQRIRAFVRRAKRTRSTLAGEVLAEGLVRAPLGAFSDRVSELDLICARDLMHPPPCDRILRFATRRRICSKSNGASPASVMQPGTLPYGQAADRSAASLCICACWLCCLRRPSSPPLPGRNRALRPHQRTNRAPSRALRRSRCRS